jgi:hypothetical protein
MKNFIVISSLFLLSVALFADENCMEHSRKCLRKSGHVKVREKRNRTCNCNCTKALANIANPQHRGRCPMCRHFHVPSEIKYKKMPKIEQPLIPSITN